MCPIAPTVSFSLISRLAKTFFKSPPYASFHLQIAVSLVSTPRSLLLHTLFACHHCIHFLITCILLITRLLTVTIYAKITQLFLMFYVNFYLLEIAVLILIFLVVVILIILLRIFVAIEIVAFCGRVYLILYELWALFVEFSDELCFYLYILCHVYNAFRCYCYVCFTVLLQRTK